MTIYTVKMINGDEIIGKLINESPEGITLSDIYDINLVFSETHNNVVLALSKYMSYAELPENITFSRHHIIQAQNAKKNVEEYYVLFSNADKKKEELNTNQLAIDDTEDIDSVFSNSWFHKGTKSIN